MEYFFAFFFIGLFCFLLTTGSLLCYEVIQTYSGLKAPLTNNMLLFDKEFDVIDGSDCHKVCFDIKTSQTPSQNTVSDIKPENQVFNDGIVLDDGKESDIIYINDVE